MWNIFNTLQIILALNLLIVQFPANVKMFHEKFEELINFEILPKDYLYDNVAVPIFDLESSEERDARIQREKEEFAEGGSDNQSEGLSGKFRGTSMMMNIMILLGAISLLVFCILMIKFCKKSVVPRCPGALSKLVTTLERKIFWNSFMRACLETYFLISISLFYAMR